MAEPVDTIRAAGAVVWRGDHREPEIALIHRPKYDDWTFPKGKVDPGEHVLLTAVREVHEETALSVTLGRPLPPRAYLKKGRPKRVDYWTATPADIAAFSPTAEVDRVDWLGVAAAAARLTYEHDAELLDALHRAPMATTPYILLRHAHAGSKARGDDAGRPLTPTGHAQAAMLAKLFSCYRPSRVISSGATRCIESVLPYARHSGTRVETDTVFGPEPYDPQAALERLLDLIDDDRPAVVCSHREVLNPLVKAVTGQLGADPPDDTQLGKGEFLVLHVAAGKVVAIEHHDPAT